MTTEASAEVDLRRRGDACGELQCEDDRDVVRRVVQRVRDRADPHGPREAEPRHQHERRARRAEHRADRVDRVERRHARADLAVGAYGEAREQRQRGAHERRRNEEDQERAGEVEERKRQAGRVRWVRLPAERGARDPGGEADRVRHGERRERDAQLEDAVDENGPRDLPRDAARDGGAGREAAHVRGEHGRDGQLGRAEHQRELPGPHRLVEERGEA